jgi:hypothetical protein
MTSSLIAPATAAGRSIAKIRGAIVLAKIVGVWINLRAA